jgi:dTDP-4-dehydrorhamnose reductase
MLVTGGSGYLGRWVAEIAQSQWEVTATYTTHPGRLDEVAWQQLDVRNRSAVQHLVHEVKPRVIVHTAALNPGQGDDFEGVNVAGTANVAAAAAATEARLIHVSTDLVFDGRSGKYTEQDSPRPVNDYGRSKARAEEAVAASGAEAVIVRTSLIYGWRPTTARAAQWMIDALNKGETIRLWEDEMRCPIWVESLAAAIVELAGHDYVGPLHIAGAQSMSRYEFGVALLRFYGISTDSVVGVPSPKDSTRPLNCTLDSSLANRLLSTPLPGVDEVLVAG